MPASPVAASPPVVSTRKPARVGPYELGNVVGAGGFGKVYIGTDTRNGTRVAIKVLDRKTVVQHDLESYVRREVAISRALKHPNVVRTLDFVETASSFALVLELAPNGELFDKIITVKHFDADTARRYFQELVAAVWYVHSLNVVHRDIKAENLLLGPSGELRLCDFGLSRYTVERQVQDSPVLFTSLAGSADYQAPEVIGTEGYQGFSCDIWSMGVVLFFMLTGYLPFGASSDEETSRRILSLQYNAHDPHIDPAARDLLEHIFVVDPAKRYTCEDIARHPWFVQGLTMERTEQLFHNVYGAVAVVTGHSPLLRHVSSFPTIGSGEMVSSPTISQADSYQLLRRAFRSVNVEGTGHLSAAEVRDALVKLNNGREVPEEEVGRFMRCFALDADGTVDEEHFVAGWRELEEVLRTKNLRIDRLVDIFHYDLEGTILRELRVAFDSLDNKHHGLITPESLTCFPQLQLSLPEAEALIDALDASGIGGGEKKHSVTFEDFVHGVIKADLLRRHPLVSRLQRLGALFDVVDRTYARTYIVNGFTVAGMRDTIQAKLLRPSEELRTQFAVGETGEYLHGDYTDPNGRRLMVGVLLQPAAMGYTKVLAYRISGRTDVFHAWFHLFRLALHAEICQCLEDTSVVGESEGI